MKYEKFAKDLVELVGGASNIKSIAHCLTRLRFKLKDTSLAKTDEIKKLSETKNVVIAGGQYQVVVGTHVSNVYKDVIKVAGVNPEGEVLPGSDDEKDKSTIFEKFVSLVQAVIMPLLLIMIAGGMINGFRILFVQFGVLADDSITNIILEAMGSLMDFFPIFVGFTAFKFFGGTPFIGMAIGAVLIHPVINEYVVPLASEEGATLFGIPFFIPSNGYVGNMIPIVAAAYPAAKLENWLRKVTPPMLVMFIVPTFTILLTTIGIFLLIGPVMHVFATGVSDAVMWLIEFNYIVYAVLFGFSWMLLVMFGLHHALFPILFMMVAVSQEQWLAASPDNTLANWVMYERMLHPMFAHWFALTGALTAVAIKTKKQEVRQVALPGIVSSLFGITEPGIYGVALPKVKPFIFALVGAAAGGLVIGIFDAVNHNMSGLGFFAIIGTIHPNDGFSNSFIGSVLSLPVGFAVAFLLTFFFWNESKEATE